MKDIYSTTEAKAKFSEVLESVRNGPNHGHLPRETGGRDWARSQGAGRVRVQEETDG